MCVCVCTNGCAYVHAWHIMEYNNTTMLYSDFGVFLDYFHVQFPMHSPTLHRRLIIYSVRHRVTVCKSACSSFCPLCCQWVETRKMYQYLLHQVGSSAIGWTISILGTSTSLCLKLSMTEIFPIHNFIIVHNHHYKGTFGKDQLID